MRSISAVLVGRQLENGTPCAPFSLETEDDVRVTERVESIGVDASIADAARALTDADVHHLVVVGHDGRAAGMLSSLDLVRALTGVAAKHPRAIEPFEGSIART
jgi:CBS-domain-containing membrane protein